MPLRRRKKTSGNTAWGLLSRFEKICESSGFGRIAGIDEAGRGPLAGPVVAAAVIFPSGFRLPGLYDSKTLTASEREFYYERILSEAVGIGVGIVESEVIDEINILQATLLAARLSVDRLSDPPDYLLTDALRLSSTPIPQKSIVRGDQLSYSIAGASVVAKVSRDRIMTLYHREYPEYRFDRHKGYGTAEHLRLIRVHGPSPIHRFTFKGVKEGLFLRERQGERGQPG